MRNFFATLIFSSITINGFSQIKATTEDGQKVILFDNGTWQHDVELVEMIEPVLMKKHDFKALKGKSTARLFGHTIKQQSSSENEITDDENWFEKNGLELPTIEVPNPYRQIDGAVRPQVPLSYNGKRLVKAIQQENYEFYIYGKDFSEGDILYVYDIKAEKMIHAFDFTAWTYSPDFIAADKDFIYQRIEWVQIVYNKLYISHGHSTYAKSSKGMNAYISAIDLTTNEVIWRTQPLVSNAYNFEIIEDIIVCGYGFTAEPDFLFVINSNNGAVLQKLPLKSGPSFIIRKEKQLFVRTYNTDYVFSID